MTRKRMAWLIVAGAVAVAAGGSLFWALHHQPDFYRETLAAPSDPAARRQAAKRFVQSTLQLVDEIKHEDRWFEEFEERQVNSWLAEELHDRYADWVPPNLREPRVKFEADRLRLAFQLDEAYWKGVVCVTVRPFVPEQNCLALEIESVKAGLIPLPMADVLQNISQGITDRGYVTEWRQRREHDVLVIHLGESGSSGPALESVRVKPGVLQITGRRGPGPGVGVAQLVLPLISLLRPTAALTR